ncbi:MAG: M55 family metallopeptidase [Candidatus Brocadiia bacterium]
MVESTESAERVLSANPMAVTQTDSRVTRRSATGRVFVKVDMEGVSGVVSREQTTPGHGEYDYARRMLMHDLQAVLDGLFAAGAREAVVYDTHLSGRNVDLDVLDSRVSLIAGRPHLQDGCFYGLDATFGALFLVGFHARAGASDALLPHTYDDDIVSLKVNGTELGEIGMEAALAGEFGVPLAFVSADSGGVREARDLLGDDVVCVEVKKAITPTSGVCLPAARTRELLTEAAARAFENAPGVPPMVFQCPTSLEVLFDTPRSAEALADVPSVERTGRVSVRTTGQNVLAAYRHFVLARRQVSTAEDD